MGAPGPGPPRTGLCSWGGDLDFETWESDTVSDNRSIQVKQPLLNRRILVTRGASQAPKLSDGLRELGAIPIEVMSNARRADIAAR